MGDVFKVFDAERVRQSRITHDLAVKRAALQHLVDDCWMLVAAASDLAQNAQDMFCSEEED